MNEPEEIDLLHGQDDEPTLTHRVAEPAPNTIYQLDELEREMEIVTDQLDDLIRRYDPAGGLVGNKEMVRAWKRMYDLWNQAELMDQSLSAGSQPSLETWQQYIVLWEFCMYTAPPGECDRVQKMAEWETYYATVARVNAWRRAHKSKTRGKRKSQES
jgi:hypothetical protein